MKVRELIEKLEYLDGEKTIMVFDHTYDYLNIEKIENDFCGNEGIILICT